MRNRQSFLLASLVFFTIKAVCEPPKNWKNQPPATPQGHQSSISYRNNCNQATKKTDLSINNVRARLLNGGDLWWDLSRGQYIVPQPKPGEEGVSAIGAGGVWLGGIDPGGNLKMACQMYRTATRTDFWPGPLDPDDGGTTPLDCWQWDKFFRVLGDDIRKHKKNFEQYQLTGAAYPADEIPKDIKGWPARGNAFFFDIHQFQLPSGDQGLAPFFDQNLDGFYDPQAGDYPVIDLKGCNSNSFPDEMVFWIFNDNGNPHTQTGAAQIGMEVQALAFAYSTQDELNDMTFYRYKMINRAVETIDSTFFAIWIDPDLGCIVDDYIGCDTTVIKVDTLVYDDANGNPVQKTRERRRDLMYVYNMDETDGYPGGCDCGGTPTYCNEVPMLGVDFLRGPFDEYGYELGMSSFMYWRRDDPISAHTDPNDSWEFYNYMNGRWADGTPLTRGGDGYNLGSTNITKFAFSSPPNDPNGWSMSATNQQGGDLRTLQSAGPFKLQPGAVNEMIIGLPWVPNIEHPSPDLEPLLYADQVAQTFFDGCLDLPPSPDAPDLDFVELDRSAICVLSNEVGSNNFGENFSEINVFAPEFLDGIKLTEEQRSYKFEGYKVFQLINPDVTRAELSDIEKARIVFQCDIKNKVSKIFDWQPVFGPNKQTTWKPIERADGNNEGIAHSFKITENQFAANNRALVNHKKYYYLAVAYAFNNFAAIAPDYHKLGQKPNYLEGRLNVKTYTVIPRPIVDRALQANYGDGAEISAFEGQGVGHVAVELKPGEHDSILAGENLALDYVAGKGPINVKIYDPLNVRDGEFDLFFIDENMDDNQLGADAHWVLVDSKSGDTIYSESTIARLNEQLISDFGISIQIGQTADAGARADAANGALAQTAVFASPGNDWLAAMPDNQDLIPGWPGAAPFHFVGTELTDPYYEFDPKRAFSNLGNKWFAPYCLTFNPNPVNAGEFRISPRWSPPNYDLYSKKTHDSTSLSDLNNVDIVFTKDTAKWSRCIVLETASRFFTDGSMLGFQTESGPGWTRKSMDTRYAISVGKQDADGDGRPDPDGAMDGNQPLRGMGWFPGYCIDVETGERLNIFFGENSIYNGIPDGGQNWLDEPANGADMMFNPTDYAIRQPLDNVSKLNPYSFPLGGQHFVYVTRQKYDGCAAMRLQMDPDKAASTSKKYGNKWKSIPEITWTAMMALPTGAKMLPYSQGLIPNDCTVSLRVDNPYGIHRTTTNGHPRYHFRVSGKTAKPLNEIAIGNSLDSIKMVPNPYYGYSNYETNYATSVVKITNLPAKCTVAIYSLDGKFIRKFDRDEMPQADPARPNSPIPARQFLPDIEWDMKNTHGSAVASGVYLVQINAPGLGERTLKWFGIGREFDPSGL